MNEPTRVSCATHGHRQGCFLCQHLATGSSLGFRYGYADDDPDAPFPDAWCDQCESVLATTGSWETAGDPPIKLVCDRCYMDARSRNWPVDSEDQMRLLAAAADRYLQRKQAQFRRDFNLDQWSRYDWTQEPPRLLFSHQGQLMVEAEVQFVGSYSSGAETWMWAWANPSFVEPACTRIREVRALGEARGLLKLACGEWPADEFDGWQMTAIAARQLGAIGAYRSPDEDGHVYLVITSARSLAA